MRIFACTLTAVRDHPIEPDMNEMVFISGIAIIEDDEDINKALDQDCIDVFPPSEGYRDHIHSCTEITQNMLIGHLCLSWSLHEVSA